MLNLSIHAWLVKYPKKWFTADSKIALYVNSRRRSHPKQTQHHHIAWWFVGLLTVFLLAVWYSEQSQSQSQPQLQSQPHGQRSVVDGFTPSAVAAETVALNSWSGAQANQNQTYPTPVPQQSIDTLPQPNFPLQDASQYDLTTIFAAHELSVETKQEQHGVDLHARKKNSLPNHIYFAAAEASWLEVYDSRGQQLVNRTLESGQQLALQGRPPFSVFVGNAANVIVEYGGEAVPFKLPKSKLFARFQLGLAE